MTATEYVARALYCADLAVDLAFWDEVDGPERERWLVKAAEHITATQAYDAWVREEVAKI